VQIISQTSNYLLEMINKLIASVNSNDSSFELEEHAIDIVKLISNIVEEQKAEKYPLRYDFNRYRYFMQ
jgi:hypothetical protein